jgi:hypothetical protein
MEDANADADADADTDTDVNANATANADATAAATATATAATTATATAAAAAAATAAATAAAAATTTADGAVTAIAIECEPRGWGAVEATTPSVGEREAAAIAEEIVEATFVIGSEAPASEVVSMPAEHGRRATASDATPAIETFDVSDLAEPAPPPVAHARLVLGHDEERVVVSIAMRHETIDVAIRTANVDLASAVSCSLDQLDSALRGHGLTLGDLVAGDQRDAPPSPRSPQARAASVRDHDGDDAEPAATIDPRLRALA